MIEGLAVFCISGCVGVEIYCGARLIDIIKQRSEERTEARRAATRDRIYNEVRQSWAIERNRKDLWSSIKK